MIPIRDVVVFPFMMIPFVVGRESSVRAVEHAMAGDKMIFLATQHDASTEEPRPGELYSVGCIVKIIKGLKQGDGNIKVLVEGVERARVVSVTGGEGFFRALVNVNHDHDKVDPGQRLELTSRVASLIEQYVELSQSLNYEPMSAAIRMDDPGKLADVAAANLQLTIEEKQELLEVFDPIDRLTRVTQMLEVEIGKLSAPRAVYRPVKRLRTSQGKSDTRRLPMMPIRDVVVFPFMMIPFVVGRESSVRALEAAIAGDKKILVVAQRDASADQPRPDDIYRVGCIARIVQSLKRGDGSVQVLLEGRERARILSATEDDGFFRALVEVSHYEVEPGQELELLTSHVTSLFEQYVRLGRLSYPAMVAAIRVDNPVMLADTVAANLQLTMGEKQELLEIFDPVDRLVRVAEILEIEAGRQAARSPAPR